MLVSVIIPFQNSQKTIKKTLISVINQTYKNIEILLVNNLSKDNSLKIIKNIKKKNTNIFIIKENIKGPSKARNTGILHSSGQLVFFVDSDDFLPKDAIKKLVLFHLKYKLDISIGNHCQKKDRSIIKKNKMIKDNIFFNKKILGNYLNKYFISHYNYLIFTHCWGKLFKLNLIKKNKIFFNSKMHQLEDTDFNFRYLKYCENIGYLNQIVYFHNLTKSINKKRASNIINLNVLYSIKTLFKNIKKFIIFRNFNRKNLLLKNLEHMTISCLIIFILRIVSNANIENYLNFIKIIKVTSKDKFFVNNVDKYKAKNDENKWIPQLLKYLSK